MELNGLELNGVKMEIKIPTGVLKVDFLVLGTYYDTTFLQRTSVRRLFV